MVILGKCNNICIITFLINPVVIHVFLGYIYYYSFY